MPLRIKNSDYQIPNTRFIQLVFFLLFFIHHLSHGMALLPMPGKQEASACDFQQVSRVIDGDTFQLSDGRKVRLLGVDTPETHKQGKKVQWFGREASRKLKEWIAGEKVCLKKDRDKTQEIDKYGRLLRYVWTYSDRKEGPEEHGFSLSEKETAVKKFFVNAEIIKQGYGFAYTRFPFEYLDDFRKYEKYARENNRGLWNEEKQRLWETEIEENRVLARTCGEQGTICPADAIHFVGDYKTVRFFVERSHDSGKAIFLNSKNNYKDDDNFSAVIFEADRNKFLPFAEDVYFGRAVDVKGIIKKHDGRAEIIMEDGSQIQDVK